MRRASAPSRTPRRCCEHATDAQAIERLADVGDLGHRQRFAVGHELRRFCGLGERGACAFARLGERKRAGQSAPHRADAALGHGAEHAIPLEIAARLRGARIGEERLKHGEARDGVGAWCLTLVALLPLAAARATAGPAARARAA